MGEENKIEETKAEEIKTEEKKPEEKKEEKKGEEPKAVPPQEIVLQVFMHCEGCAKKVRRCLKGFEGVDDVTTDCKSHKVVVKGEKADPIKVLERVQKKSHHQVELLSPIPKPPPPGEDAKKAVEKEVAKPEEKKEEPQVITVVLNVQMHCEACALEIKRRILRMKGVENVEPDLKSSQVTVRGIFDPSNLIEYIHKRTGKRVSIIKQEQEEKKEEIKQKPKEKEKKSDEKSVENTKTKSEVKKDGAEVAEAPAEGGEEVGKVVEMKKSEFYYTDPVNFQIYPQPQRFDNAYAYYAPPPQMFSDENPNACTVM